MIWKVSRPPKEGEKVMIYFDLWYSDYVAVPMEEAIKDRWLFRHGWVGKVHSGKVFFEEGTSPIKILSEG